MDTSFSLSHCILAPSLGAMRASNRNAKTLLTGARGLSSRCYTSSSHSICHFDITKAAASYIFHLWLTEVSKSGLLRWIKILFTRSRKAYMRTSLESFLESPSLLSRLPFKSVLTSSPSCFTDRKVSFLTLSPLRTACTFKEASCILQNIRHFAVFPHTRQKWQKKWQWKSGEKPTNKTYFFFFFLALFAVYAFHF